MLCAIDPDTKKLAFVVGDSTTKAGGFIFGELPLTSNTKGAFNQLQKWLHGLESIGVRHVAYEIPYMGKNVKSFQRLTEIKAKVQMAVESLGLQFIDVNPSSWQSTCLTVGRGKGTRGQKREIIKPLSEAYATDVLGCPPGSQDIADATCIHQHVAKNILPELEVA